MSDYESDAMVERYGLGTLNSHIRMCEDFIARGGTRDEAKRLTGILDSIYKGKVTGFPDGLEMYNMKYLNDGEPKHEEDVSAILEKLRLYRDELIRDANTAAASAGQVNLVQNQSTSVDVNVAVSQVYREIEQSGLSEDEANAVKALLSDAQNPPDRETRAQKLVKAVEWAADKGPKLVEAVMKAGGAIAGLPLWG